MTTTWVRTTANLRPSRLLCTIPDVNPFKVVCFSPFSYNKSFELELILDRLSFVRPSDRRRVVPPIIDSNFGLY